MILFAEPNESSMEEDTGSLFCHECLQLCDSCLYSIEPAKAACSHCIEAQLQHFEQVHLSVQPAVLGTQDLGIWGQDDSYAQSASNTAVQSIECNPWVSKVSCMVSSHPSQHYLTTHSPRRQMRSQLECAVDNGPMPRIATSRNGCMYILGVS